MQTSRSQLQTRLYRSDPIGKWLHKKLRLSPWFFGLGVAILFSGIALIVAWVSHTLWSQAGQVGLLQDWFPWVAMLFVNPIVAAYYLWSFQAIGDLIQELVQSDVVDIDRQEIGQIVLRPYYQKWRKWLALASAVGFSMFVFFTRSKLEKSWTSFGLLPQLAITVATLIMVYLGSLLVLNLLTNIQILNRIFNEKTLNVNPLHPDRCGGLRALSNYSLQTAYLVAILGLWVGVVEYQFITQKASQDYWFVHLIVPLYVVLSLVCFFGPLLSAHSGMQKAKEAVLHQVARQFHADYLEIHQSLKDDAGKLKERTEKIQQLRVLYTMTDDFPVWPFDVQTFRRYLITVPTPLLAPAIGLLQKIIPALLKQWGISLG